MLNIVSILIGIIGLLLAIVFAIPPLGAGNWLVLPIIILGAGIGALSSKNSGRNLCLVVLVIAVVRLSLGGGFI